MSVGIDTLIIPYKVMNLTVIIPYKVMNLTVIVRRLFVWELWNAWDQTPNTKRELITPRLIIMLTNLFDSIVITVD